MIEFLRIWFILCVLITHVCGIAPTFRGDLMHLLHSSGLALWKATDLFFVIAGFFLYRRIAQGTSSAGEMIKKIYLRLLPVTLFALVLLLALGKVSPANIPFTLAQLNGMGLSVSNTMGYGDWFVGTYFWTSCLFIGIFQISLKHRWLWLMGLLYVCFILKFRNTLPPSDRLGAGLALYSGLISDGFVQAISYMGIGMISAFLADKFTLSTKLFPKIAFTVFEIICVINIYKYMFDVKTCKLSTINMLLLMGCFMISIAHSWGYISTILNKMSWIQYASRYTLPVLFGHIVCFHILSRFHNFGWGEYSRGLFIIWGSIVLGIIEYHLVEKWLIPKIKVCFHS